MRDDGDNNRTKWLQDFDASLRLAFAVQDELAYLSVIVGEGGNEQLAARLSRLSGVLDEALTTANRSISRMVSEQVQASFNQIGETFKAILEVAAQSGNNQQGVPTR